ncbi:MAG: SPOR domain-containing protein [Trueperaceae bacterium]|nr:SPOR domain-containing protein [Trueperaceae bacterium]
MIRGWTAILLAGWLAWGGVASAQAAWTVQTVALRDLREANAEVARLGDLGLAAYTGFTMLDGLQYVRVRVGCFDRETAERWAAVLQTGVTPEAVALPLDAPPLGVPCVAADVGFRKPADWALVSHSGEQPTFRVEVAGHAAYLRHDGAGWRLWQAVAPPPEALPPTTGTAGLAGGVVRAATLAGRDVVRHALWGALCPGRLVAAIGDVAIVDQGDAIVACGLATAAP